MLALLGDTRLYFAHKVGSRGKVLSFEFLPTNLNVYDRNLELNPELASRIEVLQHPVWLSRDVELFHQCEWAGDLCWRQHGKTRVMQLYAHDNRPTLGSPGGGANRFYQDGY